MNTFTISQTIQDKTVVQLEIQSERNFYVLLDLLSHICKTYAIP